MANTTTSPADPTAVLCPRCQLPMLRGVPKPIMFTSGLSDVPYCCESCGTETVRTVTADGTPHIAAKTG
jgi:RNase P subunit RPR2